MNLPDDFPNVNFSVADLANLMDTAEMTDPMVTSLSSYGEYNVGDNGQPLDMDYLTWKWKTNGGLFFLIRFTRIPD